MCSSRSTKAAGDLTLRPADCSDTEFLLALHEAAMRDVVLRTWGKWDQAWQRSYVLSRLDLERIQIICLDGVAVGMVETREFPDHIYIANIKVLPAYQSRGIGSTAAANIIQLASATDRAVRLQVLLANDRARRLYERLGFITTDSTSTHVLMEYTPRSR